MGYDPIDTSDTDSTADTNINAAQIGSAGAPADVFAQNLDVSGTATGTGQPLEFAHSRGSKGGLITLGITQDGGGYVAQFLENGDFTPFGTGPQGTVITDTLNGISNNRYTIQNGGAYYVEFSIFNDISSSLDESRYLVPILLDGAWNDVPYSFGTNGDPEIIDVGLPNTTPSDTYDTNNGYSGHAEGGFSGGLKLLRVSGVYEFSPGDTIGAFVGPNDDFVPAANASPGWAGEFAYADDVAQFYTLHPNGLPGSGYGEKQTGFKILHLG